MPSEPKFPTDFRTIKSLEGKYKGQTTKPVDQSKLRVKVKPTARRQPEIKTAPEPSLGGTIRTIGGIAANAPAALADLAVSIPTAAYNYVRTTSPSGALSDAKNAVGNFVNYVREKPDEAFVETVAGTPKAAGELLREATFARDAGDTARAEQLEKLAVPMMLAVVIPGGKALKGAGKVAKAEERALIQKEASLAAKAERPAPVTPPKDLRAKIAKTMGPSATKEQIDAEHARMLKAYKAGEKRPAFPRPLQAREYTPEEQAVYDKFGSKQEAEAKRKSKVQKDTGQKSRKLVNPEDRFKVEPTKYRDMEAEQGQDAVLKAARKGEHLKQTESGYVGAPRTVTGPRSLSVMRGGLDNQLAEASNAVQFADPTGLGTWYNRARMGQALSNEPYMLPRVLEEHGVYSAGVSPESELGFALKHRNSRAMGEPAMAFRSAGMNTLDDAVANNVPADLGDKIGEYAKKQDPRNPGKSLFGVNDFRAAQTFGYTDAQGDPWKAAVSETMHPVMDAETALMVDRANAAGLGGRTDWRGEQIQEVPWIYGKAQDLYNKGYTAGSRFAGEPIEGITAALREANKSPSEFIPKHTASGTYEIAPGANTGHVPEYFTWSPEERAAYDAKGLWAQEAPEMATQRLGIFGPSGEVPPEVGSGLRDVLYGSLGMRQLPTIESSGSYRNSLGELEGNKMYMPRPLIDYPTGGVGKMSPLTYDVMDAVEHYRALNNAQEAYAFNLPNTLLSAPNKSGVLLETTGDMPIGEQLAKGSPQPTSEQLAALDKIIKAGGDGYEVTATNRGAFILPVDSDATEASARELMNKYRDQLTQVLPSEPKLAVPSTGYGPALGKWGGEGIEPTEPYSGEATTAFLEKMARLPQKVALDISENEGQRAALRDQYLRDLQLRNDQGVGYRGDLQNMRRFFAEADWPQAVELIRKGLSPAAAIAALGYSASAMAAEPEQ